MDPRLRGDDSEEASDTERLLPPFQLRRERQRAGAAARAAHGNQDALLLLLVEIGAVEHGARLLREQVVQREAARFGLIVRRRGRRAAKRLGRGRRRECLARTLVARLLVEWT